MTNDGKRQEDVYRITNTSQSTVVDTHLLIVVQGLPAQYRLRSSLMTRSGYPYLRVFLRDGVLLPGESIVQTLRFKRLASAPPPTGTPAQVKGYILDFQSGQGSP